MLIRHVSDNLHDYCESLEDGLADYLSRSAINVELLDGPKIQDSYCELLGDGLTDKSSMPAIHL